jgi:hypothetical protein
MGCLSARIYRVELGTAYHIFYQVRGSISLTHTILLQFKIDKCQFIDI